MSHRFDYRAEAQEAMRKAAAATTAIERIELVRLALAWQDLASGGEKESTSTACAPSGSLGRCVRAPSGG